MACKRKHFGCNFDQNLAHSKMEHEKETMIKMLTIQALLASLARSLLKSVVCENFQLTVPFSVKIRLIQKVL